MNDVVLTTLLVASYALYYATFGEVYGLGVQVFRKSGNVWLETTVTDSWTLKEQNDQGESLSEFMLK